MAERPRNYPLRVLVYDDVAERIRRGVLAPGARLPSEGELAEQFQVSRLTAREALLLLEEDGFIDNKRGVGRYVADRVPEVGLEGMRAIDEMLSERVKTTPDRVGLSMETATEYSAGLLEIEPGGDTLMMETDLRDELGSVVCLTLEWLPVRRPFVTDLEPFVERVSATDRYLLDVVTDLFGVGINFVRYAVSVTTAGGRRGERLGVPGEAPVLVLAQTIYHDDGPILASKHIIRSDVAHFAGVQSVNVG